MVYKVPPGDIFANNYGREHMKPSHQVSYDMRLPHNRKIPVRNDQYIQGTPCLKPASTPQCNRKFPSATFNQIVKIKCSFINHFNPLFHV